MQNSLLTMPWNKILNEDFKNHANARNSIIYTITVLIKGKVHFTSALELYVSTLIFSHYCYEITYNGFHFE